MMQASDGSSPDTLGSPDIGRGLAVVEHPAKTIAQLTKELRTSVKENQGAFAVRVGYTRTYINQIEREKISGEHLRSKLIEQFPDAEAEIEAAVDSAKQLSAINTLRRSVRRLVDEQRLEDAAAILQPYAEVDPGEAHLLPSYKDRYWAARELHRIYNEIGQHQLGRQALERAYSFAVTGELGVNSQLVEAFAEHELTENGINHALDTLERALMFRAEDGRLWFLKARLHWLECAWNLAYTSLITAIKYRAPRADTLHLIPQVLAESGRFMLAIKESGNYLDLRIDNPLRASEVVSADALAVGILFGHRSAEARFAFAERIFSDSGLLHYRHARYLDVTALNGEKHDALDLYRRAVSCREAPLDSTRMSIALRCIKTLELDITDWSTDRFLPQG